MEEIELKNNDSDLKRKSIVIPEKLKSNARGNVIQSISVLLDQIKLSVQQSEDLSTFQRIIKVLVRGIASSNTVVQQNYFLALQIIIITYKTSPWFTLKHILNAVEAELHISKSTSKGDEGEILLGRVLVFGVLVRSEALTSAPVTEQDEVLTQLLQDMKGKSYLPLIADPFLIQYLKEIDKSAMKKAVWPLIQNEVSPGPNQQLVIYHALLVLQERFPSIVSESYLQQTMGVTQVLSTSTMPGLLASLQANFKLKSCNHPVFTDIFKYLTSAQDDVLLSFWQQVEEKLLVESSLATNKHIMAIKFYTFIISNLENASQVPELLTPKLVSWLLKRQKVKPHFQKILNDVCKEAVDKLCKLCSKPESSKAVVSVIKKLIFEHGNVLLDKGPGTKVVHQLSNHLTEKGVMKLVTKLRPVITNSSSAKSEKSEGANRSWHNVERLHIVHLFCNMLALPVMRANSAWRLEQLTFLFDLGFFPTSSVGVELAGLIRDNFYNCLYHKLPNLVELRNLLAGIVKHINSRLDRGDELRIKVSDQVLKDWKKMSTAAEQVGKEKKHQSEQRMTSVFQTMFYHIGLHLFKEPAFATDVLGELHSVCKRVSGGKNGVKVENEPHWTEVVVEMFLSLLSQNSHLHRHLIGCIFSHFCPLMIPQNIYQILQVLDPSNSSNPLLNSLETDSESSSDEEGVEDNNDEGEEDMESSDDGMSDDTEEEVDEKANDKLRRAVFEALGDNGALTDVESVDLDEMDEAEARRVDKALSEAFRLSRQAKSKKPAPHAKALTNFRIRVLDLVEVWAGSEPPLDLLVDTILALVTLLEHALVDRFQAPLEVRVRAVIKKLTSTKKYVSDDCKLLKMGKILKSLLEKGNRTTTVYMSIVKELSAATMFIVKASQHVPEVKAEDEDSTEVTVFKVLKDTVDSYFHQRDCLLPVSLYHQLFQQNVPYIVKLATKLPHYVFDPSVHPFRRSKALEFLLVFFKNNRTLSEANEKCTGKLRKMSTHLYNESIKMMEEPVKKINPNFLIMLRQAFDLISRNKWMPEVDWKDHNQQLLKYQKMHNIKKEKKVKPDKINNTKMDVQNGELDNPSNEDDTSDEEDLNGGQTSEEDKIAGKLAEDESSDEEEEKADQQKKKGKLNNSEKSQGKPVKRKAPKKHSQNSSQENGNLSNDEEQNTSKSNKKSDRKKHQNRTKHTQLLKKNSKKLRLESMADGLEDNLFGKYKLLENQTS